MSFEDLINSLTKNVKKLGREANEYLTSHNCLKCGKNLMKCKCKNPEIDEEFQFDFEQCCENCGELLEDCECDDRELSMEDIALMDMLDEDDEEDDLQQELEDEEDEGLSFDDFEALDDEDDEW